MPEKQNAVLPKEPKENFGFYFILLSPQSGEREDKGKKAARYFPFEGGDPAAPSSTATLLRLHPSH